MSYVACGMCVPATIVWGGGENCGAVEITARGLLCATWLLGSGWLWSVVVPEASGAWGALAALPEQLCTTIVQSFVTRTVFQKGFLIKSSPSGRPWVFLRSRSWVSRTDGRPVRDLLADSFRGPGREEL